MTRLTRFASLLDRFEERLEVDCERLKHQLIAQVEQQFGVLRSNVRELRSRFCGGRSTSSPVDLLLNDPPVVTVSLDEWLQERSSEYHEGSQNVPSTSAQKRKSSSASRSVNNKRQKTHSDTTTDGPNKYLCKSPNCGKSFWKKDLARHERIHLGIKPFSCIWPGCRYSSNRKGSVVIHVRMQHFKLPQLQKDQTRLNIVDNRNPDDYIQVDNDLAGRRIE